MKWKTRRGTNPSGIRTNGFRSKFEAAIAEQLKSRGVSFSYESLHLGYVLEKRYTPDFVLQGGRIIEVKGWFKSEDRTKLRAVKSANPKADIRLLFQRASTKINKGSKTTYGMWADAHGFPWAEGRIPDAWLKS